MLACTLTAGMARGQTPPAPPPEVVPAPAAAPAPPVYNYSGQPIVLQAACADAELNDFGLICSAEEPCPLYLELASIEAAGAKVFIAGDFHTETETLWSVLLVSADQGRTWSEAQARMRRVALDQMQFPDAATGYVAGRSAGSLARDPFLLRTTDGGQSWKRLPLFEDGAVGLIESLHFESATQGAVEVDRGRPGAGRYEILESMTGGDAWTVRETGATRPRITAVAPAADWRISVAAASKALRIERRQGEAWRKAAEFAVAAGACRPAPAPVAAEPAAPGQVNY
ncbi:MAG: WD40/YVTN/BNR-like repeat-containing protein [Bryobacteraceae bacterium]